ncbi:hypothetical protein QQS21_000958 [Conoideocrella luteorostrata]|uniref:Uncharacterized protein n=1 Tax=Conoideocrella luteorostrata TaxID=1105319 RepID=A0AAJ0CXY5_9HYPO|nr:hypothetical protein QQS21_000958 [Conoideocrella luteorostrata]
MCLNIAFKSLLAKARNELLNAVESLAESLQSARVTAEKGNVATFNVGRGSEDAGGEKCQSGEGSGIALHREERGGG